MWSDSEDLKILADLYQIQIKVNTTKGPTDKNPVINWIYPNKEMVQFAELKGVEIEDIVLLHEFDNHFDLVVSGSSDLVKFGGLSNIQNAQHDEEEVSNDKIDDINLQFESSDKTNLDL